MSQRWIGGWVERWIRQDRMSWIRQDRIELDHTGLDWIGHFVGNRYLSKHALGRSSLLSLLGMAMLPHTPRWAR